MHLGNRIANMGETRAAGGGIHGQRSERRMHYRGLVTHRLYRSLLGSMLVVAGAAQIASAADRPVRLKNRTFVPSRVAGSRAAARRSAASGRRAHYIVQFDAPVD